MSKLTPPYAVFYALSPDKTTLISYGPQFNRLLPRGWTFSKCVETCREQAAYMRGVGIPHDAFQIILGPAMSSIITPFDKENLDVVRNCVVLGNVILKDTVYSNRR